MRRRCKCDNVETCKACRTFHNNRRFYEVYGLRSLAGQAAGLAKATARHVANGLKNVSEEEQARRRAICTECEYYNAKRDRCGVCACKLGGWLNKLRWASERCPKGKW